MLPPLGSLELLVSRVERSMLVVESRFTANLRSLTLNEVVARRRSLLRDMCAGALAEMRAGFCPKPAHDRGDWECPTCGAACGTDKSRCFHCMAPRPADTSNLSGEASAASGQARVEFATAALQEYLVDSHPVEWFNIVRAPLQPTPSFCSLLSHALISRLHAFACTGCKLCDSGAHPTDGQAAVDGICTLRMRRWPAIHRTRP